MSTTSSLAEVRPLHPVATGTADVKFRQKLYAIVMRAGLTDDGILNQDSVLADMIDDAVVMVEVAEKLAKRFYSKKIGLTIGIGPDGAILANAVARCLAVYYQDQVVKSVALEGDGEGSYRFLRPQTERLRGAHAIIIEPIIHPGRWIVIEKCMSVIEAVHVNTNVSAVGTAIRFDGIPSAFKSTFCVEHLLCMDFDD